MKKKYRVCVEIIKRDIWEVESESPDETAVMDEIVNNRGKLIDTYHPHGDEVVEVTEIE